MKDGGFFAFRREARRKLRPARNALTAITRAANPQSIAWPEPTPKQRCNGLHSRTDLPLELERIQDERSARHDAQGCHERANQGD